jgi:hypothetical protein
VNWMVLDRVVDQLKAGCVSSALDNLFGYLARRREEDAEGWPDLARLCSNHPLRDLLLSDPFTNRAFVKPRRYAGDAVMMDYIYGLAETADAVRAATPLGRAIFRYMNTRPSAHAVRYRRLVIAGLLDDQHIQGVLSRRNSLCAVRYERHRGPNSPDAERRAACHTPILLIRLTKPSLSARPPNALVFRSQRSAAWPAMERFGQLRWKTGGV